MQVSPFGPLQNIPLQHSPGDTGPAEAPGTHGPRSSPVEENFCPCLLLLAASLGGAGLKVTQRTGAAAGQFGHQPLAATQVGTPGDLGGLIYGQGWLQTRDFKSILALGRLELTHPGSSTSPRMGSAGRPGRISGCHWGPPCPQGDACLQEGFMTENPLLPFLPAPDPGWEGAANTLW